MFVSSFATGGENPASLALLPTSRLEYESVSVIAAVINAEIQFLDSHLVRHMGPGHPSPFSLPGPQDTSDVDVVELPERSVRE